MKHPHVFFVLLSLVVFSGVPPIFAQETGKKPEGKSPEPSEAFDPMAAREMIQQWVTAERLLSEEKTTWKVEKSRMQELLDLYQKELKLLDEEISQAGASAEMVDERQETYKKELKEYRQAQTLLTEALARLLPRVRALIPRLPESLQTDLAADRDVLESDEALSNPRDVLKSMLAVMAASGRFNRSITVVEETRRLSGGKKIIVDVLYLGLARAYYASESGTTAGIGVPGPKGWQWAERPELAKEVRHTMAVYRKDSQPKLIQLPLSISDESTTK